VEKAFFNIFVERLPLREGKIYFENVWKCMANTKLACLLTGPCISADSIINPPSRKIFVA